MPILLLFTEEVKMSRRLISSNSAFEEAVGYSRAVIDGNWLFLSGTLKEILPLTEEQWLRDC